MKRKLTRVAIGLAIALASGCGMTEMPSKIDQSNANMNDMKAKMDQSNQNMADMKSKMDITNQAMTAMQAKLDTSNQTQAQLLQGIQTSNQTQQSLLAGIQMSNTTQTQLLGQIQASNQTQTLIKAAVDLTNTKMEVTNTAIHLQTLAQAETGLFSDQATAYLSPVPIDMVPFGQTLAAALQESEFAPLMGAWLQDVNSPLDPTHLPDGKTADQAEHDKLVRLWALRIVSGTAPQALIQATFNTEFAQGGPQSDIVPMIMAARWDFIYNVLLNSSLLTLQLDNPGKILLAEQLCSALDYIDNLPGLPSAALVLATGAMLTATDNVTLTVDSTKVDAVWTRIAGAFIGELGPQYAPMLTGTDANSQALQALKAAAVKRAPPATPAPTMPPAPATPTPTPTPTPATPSPAPAPAAQAAPKPVT